MENDTSTGRERRRDGSPGWLGFILIILGFIFLAQQFGNFSFDNWWALFILIPALSAFGSGFSMWQRDGKFHYGVFSTFYGGMFPLLVALMFMFNLDWGDYWPLFVILGGFGTMLSGLSFARPEEVKVPQALIRHRPWPFFIGLAALLLGLTFLGRNLGIYDLTAYIPFDNWWGVFVLIASLGGFGTALLLYLGRNANILMLTSLAGGAIVALVGIIAILDLNWELMNLVTPIILILAGLGLLFGLGRRSNE